MLADAAVPIGGPERTWAALDSLMDGARVVMLGEPWHGDGAAMEARTRMVEHLHDAWGFDVLAFEADFFAVQRAWEDVRRTGDVDRVKAQIYPFWARTRSMAALWDHVNARMKAGDTLHIAGIDPKLVGPLSRTELPALLESAFGHVPGTTPEEAHRAAATLHAALDPVEGDTALLTGTNFDRLGALLARSAELPQADPFQAQVLRSVRRNVSGEARDAVMAANLLWLATQRYPGHKIIVWAHNNHVLADKWMVLEAPGLEGLPTTDEERTQVAYLGDEARRSFGSALVSIATTVYEGGYSAGIGEALGGIGLGAEPLFDSVAVLPPAPEGTLEHALAQRVQGMALIDLRPFRARSAVRSRVLDYSELPPIELRLAQGYDGLLFLHTTHGLNEER